MEYLEGERLQIMHQSIPAVPIPSPPPGNCGAFAHVVSPGSGAVVILLRPRGLGISIPPGIWHTCLRKTDKFIGKDEAFVKDSGLSIRD